MGIDPLTPLGSERGRVVTQQAWGLGKGGGPGGSIQPRHCQEVVAQVTILDGALCCGGRTPPGEEEEALRPWAEGPALLCNQYLVPLGCWWWGDCAGTPSSRESCHKAFIPNLPAPCPTAPHPRSSTECPLNPLWARGWRRLSEQPGARVPWLCGRGKARPPGSCRLDAIRENQPKARGSCRPAPFRATHASG